MLNNQKRSYAELMKSSAFANASYTIFGCYRKEDRMAMIWTPVQKNAWMKVKCILNSSHDVLSDDSLIRVAAILDEYLLLTTETIETPKDYKLPGTNVYKTNEVSEKSSFDKAEFITGVDEEISADVSNAISSVKVISKGNGIKGSKGHKNPELLSTFKTRIASAQSIRRGKGLSELYIAKFVCEYTRLYNSKFNTSFLNYYSKPSRSNKTEDRLRDYVEFSKILENAKEKN